MSDLNVKDIERLALKGAVPQTVSEDGVPFMVIHNDCHKLELETLLPAPLRIKRGLEMEDVPSFVEYWKRWKSSWSELLASQESLKLVAIFDAHQRSGDDSMLPSWCSHTATYACPLSREWLAWTVNDRRKMSQVEFAEWLEDHVEHVVEPEGTELLSLANQLSIIRKAVFGSSQVLSSGEFSYQYSQENERGSVEIPATITLGIPVFEHGTDYKVKARFKHRLQDGVITFWYELIEPQAYVDDAFEQVASDVQEALGVTALFVRKL